MAIISKENMIVKVIKIRARNIRISKIPTDTLSLISSCDVCLSPRKPRKYYLALNMITRKGLKMIVRVKMYLC